MKSELAEELLTQLMNWDRGAFLETVRRLEAMAQYKYDDYGNFHPGARFLESLAYWLAQFPDPLEREVALDFILQRLLFVSDVEVSHLIDLVYPFHMEVVLRRRIAEQEGISPFAVAKILEHPSFSSLRRRSLIVGSSDGSRLDRLRRAAPALSHEQFVQTSNLSPELVQPMQQKLKAALGKLHLSAPPTFSHIFLVDDFSGSGQTLLRREGGEPKGKLAKLEGALPALAEGGLVSEDVRVTVILYVASEQAREHIEREVAESSSPQWNLRVVQLIPRSCRVDVSDPPFAALSDQYYDEFLTDEFKGRAPLGYADCALPLVLSHNTPNNSASLIWADTSDESDSSLKRRALFPRYERHHRDRP